MAFAEIYVDPSIAADSGAGTVGDPYGDLEYAIEQETFNTTTGTRINVKAGTSEVLAASLSTGAMLDTSVSIAWAPIQGTPMIIQGYTSTAGDGGIGSIDGNALYTVSTGNRQAVVCVDMELFNTGANAVFTATTGCSLMRCELHTSTGGGAIALTAGMVTGCYIHDVGGTYMIQATADTLVADNHLDSGTTVSARGITCNGAAITVQRNIIIGKSGFWGIELTTGTTCEHNSIFCTDAGTGFGISPYNTNVYINSLRNNIVEGFSGAGGYGFYLDRKAGASVKYYGGNASYNNTTHFSSWAANRDVWLDLGDNETLTASAFTNAPTDFSPVDTGNVKEGALPQIIGGGLV